MSGLESTPLRYVCRVSWMADARQYRAYICGRNGRPTVTGDSDTPARARRVAFVHLRTIVGLLKKRQDATGADLWNEITDLEDVERMILKADPSAEYADDCEPRGVGRKPPEQKAAN